MNTVRTSGLQGAESVVSTHVPRPWMKYPEVEMRETVINGEPVTYFVGMGNPECGQHITQIEFFNSNKFQGINSRDPLSVLECCREYGAFSLPLAFSSQLQAWFESRSKHSFNSIRADFDGGYSDGFAIMNSAIKQCLPSADWPFRSKDPLDACRLTKAVQNLERHDAKVSMAISYEEAAMTIGLLQRGTVLVASYEGSISGNNASGDCAYANDVVLYLENARLCNQTAPPFFHIAHQSSYDGTPIMLSYQSRSAADPHFKKAAESFGEGAEAQYEYFLGFDIRNNAQLAYDFLKKALDNYQSPLLWRNQEKPSKFINRFQPDDNEKQIESALLRIGGPAEYIVEQFLKVTEDSASWRECANCGRIFKINQESKPKKKIRETRFCCRSCNVSYNQKQSRKSTEDI